MTKVGFASLVTIRRVRALGSVLFLLLAFTVCVQHLVAGSDLDDDVGVVLHNDEAVEGNEILSKLTLANDLITPYVSHVQRLEHERPLQPLGTERSLLIVRGLESRAPPATVSFA
jgi:hypothetical protein